AGLAEQGQALQVGGGDAELGGDGLAESRGMHGGAIESAQEGADQSLAAGGGIACVGHHLARRLSYYMRYLAGKPHRCCASLGWRLLHRSGWSSKTRRPSAASNGRSRSTPSTARMNQPPNGMPRASGPRTSRKNPTRCVGSSSVAPTSSVW